MEEDGQVDEGTGIVKARSAYMHFNKLNTASVKEELLREGKECSLGNIVTAISAKWKDLDPSEKEQYEEMARQDKERYQQECRARDAEVARLQEERRKANAMVETETRMRVSTMASTDSSTIKADAPKRKREVSEAVKEERDARKQAKQAEENAIATQHGDLKKSRLEQAEARLKYLLNQSDIFTHFGVGSKATARSAVSASPVEEESKNGGQSSSRHRGKGIKKVASSANFDELDEDEKYMARELGDDDAEGESVDVPTSTVLSKQPSSISGGAMRPYQLEGLNWMIRLRENGINGILADEMGLGKTLQSISVLAYLKQFLGINGPHLIMVPKSTLSNWVNEFQRWCPSMRIIRFHGSKEERLEFVHEKLKPSAYHDKRGWDVCITTYEIVNLERNALTKIAWRYLIIDEAHRLKNEASQFSQTVRMLNTEHRLLLTGTPLQNNLHELWALLNFLLPDVFASAEQFDEWFNLDVDDMEAKQRMISQLHKILRPFMLRRLKADVEKTLPPKTETILFTGLSAVQKNLYRQILLRDIDSINGGSNGSRTAILNIVMQLRKCCNHPYLFPGVEDRTLDPLGDHLSLNCGKMVLLDKLLHKLKERGHRVLIFSQMTRMLDILEDYLVSQGYRYCRIDGNTTYEEREDRIADYNAPGSDKFIFLLSTRAGGLGINLQTADTVILYDSDWNPQADLQAQDRAHRIGQKRPVHVFRLVTDETVEVKVVERAQQKLKLDAMVVQQGRLQEKDKKLSKQDLLETIRFGADKVFRSKESTITDDDIDLILEKGRKRTEEMNEKLSLAEKGDLYDFRLDGGMSAQTFEGKDYSDRALRESELNALAGFAFIDTGKRERKIVASYSDSIARMAVDETADKRSKIPRHLRLPKMDDWQFYDRVPLHQLQDEELQIFGEMFDKGEVPQGITTKFILLSPEKHELKTRLIGEAFSSWTKVHYNNFIRAAAKHGRSAIDKIAKDVGRPVEEVKRYSATFWRKGPTDLPSNEWERVVKQIEKGEKRLEEIQRLTSATAKLIMMFNDPWEELTFRNVGNQGRIYNAVEDRFLLCLTHLHGYGNWDQVRSSIRRCDRFRFDFYLQSCSAETLGKRCELLMRAAERELAEIEKKKQAADAMNACNARPKDAAELTRARMDVLLQEIKTESQRLAQARIQLQKIKAGKAAAAPKEKEKEKPATSSAVVSSLEAATGNAKGGASSSAGTAAASASSEAAPGGGAEKKKAKKPAAPKEGEAPSDSATAPPRPLMKSIVPDGLLPELCKLLKAAGPDGIGKVVEKFVTNHPTIPKRQVEMKINEVAVKEKRPEDTKQVWHLNAEFVKFVEMENFETKEDMAAAVSQKGKTHKRKAENSADGGDSHSAPQKPKTASSVPESSSSSSATIKPISSSSTAATPSVSAPALLHHSESSDAQHSPSLTAAAATGHGSPPGPKKYKLSFAWFVKDKRAEAEKLLSDPSDTTGLRSILKTMWDELDADTRLVYMNKETEDKARYDRELEAYQNEHGHRPIE